MGGSRRPVRKATSDRNARGKLGKTIINTTIPSILRANARARKGVAAVELIVDPTPTFPQHAGAAVALPKASPSQLEAASETASEGSLEGSTDKPPDDSKTSTLATLVVADTLEAASNLHTRNLEAPPHRRPRIAILNMASPLRPGGGVLSGATSQEESLCRRTTLYPSLKDEFYRLPELGAIYTPDVLVFRLDDDLAAKSNDKKDWFFIDVVTAAMHRLPEVDGCGREQKYAEDRDREATVKKMMAVMQIVKDKRVGQVVLGAWGCGAYGNPVGEIARAWRKVLLRAKSSETDQAGKVAADTGSDTANNRESSRNIEVVFAIKDAKMAEAFREAFGDQLLESISSSRTSTPEEVVDDE